MLIDAKWNEAFVAIKAICLGKFGHIICLCYLLQITVKMEFSLSVQPQFSIPTDGIYLRMEIDTHGEYNTEDLPDCCDDRGGRWLVANAYII